MRRAGRQRSGRPTRAGAVTATTARPRVTAVPLNSMDDRSPSAALSAAGRPGFSTAPITGQDRLVPTAPPPAPDGASAVDISSSTSTISPGTDPLRARAWYGSRGAPAARASRARATLHRAVGLQLRREADQALETAPPDRQRLVPVTESHRGTAAAPSSNDRTCELVCEYNERVATLACLELVAPCRASRAAPPAGSRPRSA